MYMSRKLQLIGGLHSFHHRRNTDPEKMGHIFPTSPLLVSLSVSPITIFQRGRGACDVARLLSGVGLSMFVTARHKHPHQQIVDPSLSSDRKTSG